MIKICPKCTAPAIPRGKFCQEHRTGKRCIELGCGNVAQSGGKLGCCIKHGGGQRCIEPLCGNFIVSGGKLGCCIKHGGGMKILCNFDIIPKCTNKTVYGGKPGCCKAHGGGQRCPNCITWIDSRIGDSKYDSYCATCFKVIFPTDERSKVIYQHTKEIMVRNRINDNFDGFIHDLPLYTGDCDCTHRRRIDHRKLIGNTILAIETDEFAHRSYDKDDEEIRYNDLYMIHGGKWIFIRFNPDNTKTIKVDIEDKLICLIETIQKHIYRIENDENEEPVEIHPMYFDL